MVLIALIVLLWVIPLFSGSVFFSNEINTVVGLFLCICGLGFAVWARRTLGTNWSANPVEVKAKHVFITTGPYRIVRHPIYTGVIFALAGTFLVDNRWRTLLLFIIVSIGMVLRSRLEDELMARQFPQEYPGYKKRVPALIPGVF